MPSPRRRPHRANDRLTPCAWRRSRQRRCGAVVVSYCSARHRPAPLALEARALTVGASAATGIPRYGVSQRMRLVSPAVAVTSFAASPRGRKPLQRKVMPHDGKRAPTTRSPGTHSRGSGSIASIHAPDTTPPGSVRRTSTAPTAPPPAPASPASLHSVFKGRLAKARPPARTGEALGGLAMRLPDATPFSGFWTFLCRNKKSPSLRTGIWGKAPGDDLLSHGLSHTTIGAAAFHFRVRDGIGWFHSANFTRETVGVSPCRLLRSSHGCAVRRKATGASLS
jgi:hypothetical protein